MSSPVKEGVTLKMSPMFQTQLHDYFLECSRSQKLYFVKINANRLVSLISQDDNLSLSLTMYSSF
jgi:hypothetical protein